MSTALPLAELGHYALVLAFALTLVQSSLPLIALRARDLGLLRAGTNAAVGAFACLAIAFAALVACYVTSDFSVQTVWGNSHSAKPLLFKITGAWGNHEGSMLLWVLILGLFSALLAVFGRSLPYGLHARVLAVQGWLAGAFLLFILLTSNPFARIEPAPLEGQDLNPILQDIGLAIHPPLLYVGYVGFSVAFSFAVAALMEKRTDASWALWVRPWTLLAWSFLNVGLAMGSYWAYYELGWGGFWFWDPVENASFMPWLAGTALLHSAAVMEKRGALKIWTILLAILTFSLSLLGTFLVRSGVLTSVHTFAADPARGVFILGILTVFIGGALALFAVRAPDMKQGGLFAPISREGALVFNNLFLAAATATVLVGTLYPLALEAATGAKISVGAPFFHMTFVPLVIPLLLAMPFGPLLAWKRGDLFGVAQRLGVAMLAALAAVATTALVTGAGGALPALGVGLGAWLIAGALVDLAERTKLFRASPATSFSRLWGIPRSSFGGMLAHAGMGVCVLGIVCATSFQREIVVAMAPGEEVAVAGFALRFEGLAPATGPNFTEQRALFAVRRGGDAEFRMQPAKRYFAARDMVTTEAAIATLGLSQLYVSLGDQAADGTVSVRASFKPMVTLIWLGPLVMAAGGALSLSDRRFRIGAPRKAAVRAATA